MNILVTGAAGFMGSHLCDYLLDCKHNVFGLDNFFRGNKKNLPNHKNFKFYNFNLLFKDGLKNIINDNNVDLIIHYAAINGTKYFYDIPFKVCNENLVMTQNLLSCTGQSVKKIIYASSSEVYGPSPKTPTNESQPIILHSNEDRDSYASSKAMGEFLVRLWAQENKKEYIILRPFNTYGSRMATNGYGQVIPEFIERILKKENFFMYGDGKQTRSFCHITDHVKILSDYLIHSQNQIFNIGFNEEINILNLAKSIHNLLNEHFNPTHVPAWSNDTKWRKPCLSKLKSEIGSNYKFVSLNKGLIEILKNQYNLSL